MFQVWMDVLICLLSLENEQYIWENWVTHCLMKGKFIDA